MISGILNVINVVRPHILGDGNVFSRHQQVKRMSDGSHVIYGIMKVVNVVRHYLEMERLKECPGDDLNFQLSLYCCL